MSSYTRWNRICWEFFKTDSESEVDVLSSIYSRLLACLLQYLLSTSFTFPFLLTIKFLQTYIVEGFLWPSTWIFRMFFFFAIHCGHAWRILIRWVACIKHKYTISAMFLYFFFLPFLLLCSFFFLFNVEVVFALSLPCTMCNVRVAFFFYLHLLCSYLSFPYFSSSLAWYIAWWVPFFSLSLYSSLFLMCCVRVFTEWGRWHILLLSRMILNLEILHLDAEKL